MTTSTADQSAIKQVFAAPGFARFWVANVLTGLANGSSRFVFVWLVGTLTDWDAAATILGIAAGAPAFFLSVHAGLLIDRMSPRKFGMALLLATSACFAVAAGLATSSYNSVSTAVFSAFLVAIPLAASTPLFQALVPLIVPRDRIMQAVALQNMGGMLALIVGAATAGGLIQVFGIAASLWFLTAVPLVAVFVYAGAGLPDAPPETGKEKLDISQAVDVALKTEPLRTLMFLTFITGIATAASFILLPIYAQDVLEVESAKASMLNVTMGIGMVTTSLLMARQSNFTYPGRVTLAALSIGLGTGLFLIGLQSSYLMTLLITGGWGMCGGVAMTGLRSLMQTSTPPEMMGRVMGFASFAQNGSFPLGSAVLFVLVELTSIQTALVLIGLIIAVLVWSQWFRPVLRNLTSP